MIRRGISYTVVAITVLLMLVQGRNVSALPPTILTGCQTISVPGFYEIESAIATSTVQPCIDITAAGVTLSIESGGLTGDGSHGTGIRIEHGATGTVIQGWLQPSGPPVNGFNIGVEDDQGGSVIGGFEASNNATTGLLLNHADGDVIMDLTAENNGHDGIHVMQTAGARIESTGARNNGTYGFWIEGSTNTLLDRVGASGNGTTNVEIGMAGGTASTGNLLYDVSAHDAPSGIVIEKGSLTNHITRSGPLAGKHATVRDALDNNPHCGTNAWFNNTAFVKRKPITCVH